MKYEEIKEELLDKSGTLDYQYKLKEIGWDAHEALDLPVLFNEWIIESKLKFVDSKYSLGVNNRLTVAGLYQYWIEKVYSNSLKSKLPT